MSKFTKLRELVKLARDLNAEADRMASKGRGYWDRRIEAEEYRAKAEWLAGRIDRDEYNARLIECQDARNFPVD